MSEQTLDDCGCNDRNCYIAREIRNQRKMYGVNQSDQSNSTTPSFTSEQWQNYIKGATAQASRIGCRRIEEVFAAASES